MDSVQTAVHGGTQTIVGTYGYIMPPEQFGGKTTPASDLYALGATLIYLATGQHPDPLPQEQMRIQFEEWVNFSQHLINRLAEINDKAKFRITAEIGKTSIRSSRSIQTSERIS